MTTTQPTDTSVPRPPLRRHFPLFDSLRAVAALMVVVYHVGLASNAYATQEWGRVVNQFNAGVAVFFVISGFLLYRPFVASRLSGVKTPGVRGYARRRALRILPAYWFALVALAIFPGLPGVFTDEWWKFFFFLQVYDPATQFEGLRPAWSLCVEVSFYAALPLYALGMRRVLQGRRVETQVRFEMALLAGMWLATFAMRQIFTGRLGIMEPHDNLLYTLPATLDWFALGMGLALLSAAVDITGARNRLVTLVEERPLAVWTAGIGIWLLTTIPRGDPATIHHVAAGFLGLVLVLPAAFGGEKAPHRILASRPLAWLGVISYGIFLWHEPFTDWFYDNGVDSFGDGTLAFLVLMVPVLIVSVVGGAFSFYVIERPFLRKRRRAAAGGAAAAATAGTPAVAEAGGGPTP
jgi:peptidoglycan/LPS O-acetylase OafA/YrhL